MSADQLKSAWTDQDTRALSDTLAGAVASALESEAPENITEEQARRLRSALSSALAKEAVLDARRAARRFFEEESRKEKRAVKDQVKADKEADSVERLSLHIRVQHMILFSSCILLILTGLPIKFHEAALSAFLIDIMGGPSVTRILHRIGAIALTFIGVYHIYYCMVFKEGRKTFDLLIPKVQDAKDALHQIGYFLGIKKDRPLYGRFSYIEKFDYWAVYWGMVVMITSGYILWFKDWTINAFGKYVFDIGREAHSDEALLATLAIVIWHFYNVHFNPHKFPGSLTWLNGKITMEEFKEEHPLEYEEWEAAQEKGGAS
jgi:formate dehydrogenase subunit gamma